MSGWAFFFMLIGVMRVAYFFMEITARIERVKRKR